MALRDRHILLGVGGGIACYRSAELVRLLRAEGAVVRCVMTASAEEFITPLTLESLSGEAVYRQLFALTEQHAMGHIALARWADLLLIAPATANLIARLAHGMADDLLTTLALVCEAPKMVAPAMNGSMWQAAATRRNVAQLRADGVTIADPEAGALACGEAGVGRMRTPERLLEEVRRLFTPQLLRGQRWVVTTGPTWEAWDSVRLLTNRASGTVGAEIARVATRFGAEVTLIAGPGTPYIAGVRRVDVEGAEQMLAAALDHAADAALFIAAAAVSDYRVAEPSARKLKRGGAERVTLTLVRNRDIVAAVAAMARRPRRVVAFAAEEMAHDRASALAEGRRKLAAKGVDGIVVNDVSTMGHEGGCHGCWFTPEQPPVELQGDDKAAYAQAIVRQIIETNNRSSDGNDSCSDTAA